MTHPGRFHIAPFTLHKITLNPLYLAILGDCFSNFMHPSIGPLCNPASPALRAIKVLEPIPAALGWRQGYTLDKLPVYQLLSPKTNNHSHSHQQQRLILQFLDCGRKLEKKTQGELANIGFMHLFCKYFTKVLHRPARETPPIATYIISPSKSTVQFGNMPSRTYWPSF